MHYLITNDRLLQLEQALALAPEIDALLHTIESRLLEVEVERGDPRDNIPDSYSKGDLMWRRAVGWAISRSDVERGAERMYAYLQGKGRNAELLYGWYWNASLLAEEDDVLFDLLSSIRLTMDDLAHRTTI